MLISDLTIVYQRNPTFHILDDFLLDQFWLPELHYFWFIWILFGWFWIIEPILDDYSGWFLDDSGWSFLLLIPPNSAFLWAHGSRRRLFVGRMRLRVRNAALFAREPEVKRALERGIARSLEVPSTGRAKFQGFFLGDFDHLLSNIV